MKQTNSDPEFSEKNFTWRDGKLWFHSGVEMFKHVKSLWYLNCFMLAMLVGLLSNLALPLVSVLIIFVTPLMTAFIINACYHVKSRQVWNFSSLWQAVFRNIQSLIILSVMSALFSVVAHYIQLQLLNILSLPIELTEEMVKNMTLNEAVVRTCLNVITNLPMAMALAFAPALILFNQATPITAVKYSFKGVTKSWKAFLALTIIFMLVSFAVMFFTAVVVAVLVAALGMASQILVTVIVMFFIMTVVGIGLCSQYQAFFEVFKNDLQNDNDNGDESKSPEFYSEI